MRSNPATNCGTGCTPAFCVGRTLRRVSVIKLILMDYRQYEEWSENARLARMVYLKGGVTAEEFLRKIDVT